MRLACPQQRLDCLPIIVVPLNLNCRDEIIPILPALQHLYGHEPSRRQLLRLVGQDVNKTSSNKLGRRGLNYWEIVVLAAMRLGCNLDYAQAPRPGGKPSHLATDHGHRRLARRQLSGF